MVIRHGKGVGETLVVSPHPLILTFWIICGIIRCEWNTNRKGQPMMKNEAEEAKKRELIILLGGVNPPPQSDYFDLFPKS